MEEHLFTDLCKLVVACAFLAWGATRLRQPVLLAYLFGGMLAGPPLLNLVGEVGLLNGLSQIGITLLLFLAGMVLHPNRLGQLMKDTLLITTVGCLIFLLSGYVAFRLIGFQNMAAWVAAGACMFSSTILVVKLLPTTTLHQRHMGSVCIAILIAQDFIAVLLLVLISGDAEGPWVLTAGLLLGKTLLLGVLVFLGEQYALRTMMRQTDHYHEVLYILCIGWCMGSALLAHALGLSYEIGAFLAGLSIARSPLSRFLTEQLKPLRDFFLMLFFFTLGAQLRPDIIVSKWWAIFLLSLLILVIKPPVYRLLFRRTGESKEFARETGIRLSPASEFGLIVSAAALLSGRLTEEAAVIIQSVIIVNMILSSWWVVFKTPTPLAFSSQLKQD